VPFRLVRAQVQVRVTATTVEVFAAHSRVACHAYSSARGRHTTVAEHMPAAHRAHREWTPAKLLAWGSRIGPSTAAVVRWQLEQRPHPEQGYRACLGLQRLARTCGAERLEAACTRALAIGAPLYRSVDSILKRGVDRQPLAAAAAPLATVGQHDNVRGPDYYH
jgi:transposase